MEKTRAPLWFAITVGVVGLFWAYRTFVFPETPQTTVFPETEFGRSTQWVYGFTNYLLLAIFVAIEGWLLYTLFRFRQRSDALPEQTHGQRGLEVGFTLATTLLVVVLFIPSCGQIFYTQTVPPDGALVVEVTGRQWWWEFYYPEFDLVTANELVLPVGRTAHLKLDSADVIHSFWFPRMGGKRDLVPGRGYFMWFTPERPGEYEGQCAEYCGSSHANMSMFLKVKAPADFEAWVASQKAPAPPSADPRVQQGQVAFLTAGGCITCHNTFQNDKNVRGQKGPNLRKVSTRSHIAAGTLPNSPEHMTRWIQDPQKVKPGALMQVANPATAECTGEGLPKACCIGAGIGNCLPEETVDLIVAYLQSLK